jgi:hypothetical protein
LLNIRFEILETRTEVLSFMNPGLFVSQGDAISQKIVWQKFSGPCHRLQVRTLLMMAVVNTAAHFLSLAIASLVRWPQIHSEPLHAFRLRPR